MLIGYVLGGLPDFFYFKFLSMYMMMIVISIILMIIVAIVIWVLLSMNPLLDYIISIPHIAQYVNTYYAIFKNILLNQCNSPIFALQGFYGIKKEPECCNTQTP